MGLFYQDGVRVGGWGDSECDQHITHMYEIVIYNILLKKNSSQIWEQKRLHCLTKLKSSREALALGSAYLSWEIKSYPSSLQFVMLLSSALLYVVFILLFHFVTKQLPTLVDLVSVRFKYNANGRAAGGCARGEYFPGQVPVSISMPIK